MKRHKTYDKYTKRGFSLIEILLYMALLGIFLYTLTNLFVASVDVRLETEANSAVEQDGRYLINKIRYDLTQADSISTPAGVGASGNTLQIVEGGTTYTYSVNAGEDLIVSDGTSQSQLNSSRSKVTSIDFTRRGLVGGRNSITVNVTLESRVLEAKGPQTRTFDMTYATR